MRSNLLFLMIRLAQATMVALLVILVGGPRSSSLAIVVPQSIRIVSTPVLLQPDDPRRTRVGKLTLLAGWKLASRSPQFGGWSALHIDGDRVTAIGDYGSVLRFRLTRFGRATDARIDPLPAGCGRMDDKRQRDSEALTAVADGWWVGYEADNRLCKVAPDFSHTMSLQRPAVMDKWDGRYGAEAVLRLVDGRFLVFAERPPKGEARRPLLIFMGDPAVSGTLVRVKSYKPPEGYNPTDAAQLPDGSILVLNRRFGISGLFDSVLTIVGLAELDHERAVAGAVVARLGAPTLHDNFEGLAVTVERDQPIVWMISDDNFLSWQETFLLKFVLDPIDGAKPPAPAKAR